MEPFVGPSPAAASCSGGTTRSSCASPHDLAAVRDEVASLRAAVAPPAWADARARVEALRSRLSLEATAAAYERILRDVT